MVRGAATKGFQFVPEATDRFLALFPHRFDYIWAQHPRPGDRPAWQTENRHPLSDRLIRRGAYLYGVRFGPKTSYCLLDIDRKSPYHPINDRFAVGQIVAALEPLGIVSHLAVTSSYSGGIHVYIPFEAPVISWQIAAGVTHLIQAAGYTVEPGTLEVLPNPRSYDPDTNTLYKAHRLPLQQGSYLLNDDWEMCHTSEAAFTRRWEWCTSKNHIHTAELRKTLAEARKQQHRLSHRASKFLDDLNSDIDAGWTGHGQTNFLLGRVALREYIFHHVINGGKPLTGDRLICAIVGVATQLPGYRDWCRHQHEIWHRAEEWARCVEASYYWQYKAKTLDETPTQSHSTEQQPWQSWQEWESLAARDKLRYAIANLLDTNRLPAGAKDRFAMLTKQYRLSGSTLYKHRDLWHPDHIKPVEPMPVENPPATPLSLEEEIADCLGASATLQNAPSLLSTARCNQKPRATFKRSVSRHIFKTRCNQKPRASPSDFDRKSDEEDP